MVAKSANLGPAQSAHRRLQPAKIQPLESVLYGISWVDAPFRERRETSLQVYVPAATESSAAECSRLAGSQTINSAPPSGRFLASTEPPCCSTIFCTTASPRPVPLVLV